MFRRSALYAQDEGNWQHFRAAEPESTLLARGDLHDQVFVLCAGWAFQYIQLSDGGRQILKFLLPGDVFSSASIFEAASHLSVKALTGVRIGGFARSEIREKCRTDPEAQSEIARIFVVEARDTAEFLCMLGRCSGEQRIAHLILHLVRRIAARHEITGQRYPFPLKQQHIADTVGLTSVHVSRVLSDLRGRGMISLSGGSIEILDLLALEQLGSVVL